MEKCFLKDHSLFCSTTILRLFVCLFDSGIFLHSPSYPGTCVDQAGLRLAEVGLPLPESWNQRHVLPPAGCKVLFFNALEDIALGYVPCQAWAVPWVRFSVLRNELINKTVLLFFPLPLPLPFPSK